jgi:hypothetical protein
VAASDYLDPLFLPQLVAQIKAAGAALPDRDPPAVGRSDYQAQLAQGEVDVVIGNWLKPPEDLHLGRLLATRWCAWWRRPPGRAARLDAAELAGGRAHRTPRPPTPARAA